MKYNEYDDKTLKHLQSLELMILKDFIKICEENNLTYYMYAGSLLGTIRHNGFIPWDDDLDVIMFRDDFEKFKKFLFHLKVISMNYCPMKLKKIIFICFQN